MSGIRGIPEHAQEPPESNSLMAVLDENMAFGHIMPAYQFAKITPEVLKQVIQKTAGGIKYAVLDQRMQGNLTEREPILKTIAELGIELKKLK